MRKALPVLLVVAVLLALVAAASKAAEPETVTPATAPTVQGKTVEWWAKRAVQARKDANARRATVLRQRREIKQLHRTLLYQPSVDEAVRLAALVYPRFSQARAWRIIKHESWMTADPLRARNPSSTATGLYQFLTSTYASTPFGRAGFSIFSPYAQSLAAGWMHEHGRGCEWDIDC